MNITVSEQLQRTVTIIIKERLDVVSAPELKSQVERFLDEDVVDFVIDLSQTPFMDSAGMAVLVTLLRRCRMKNGSVKLVWPAAEPVQRTLILTRFDHVFEIIGRQK
jgi:anti-anti-sigma factor